MSRLPRVITTLREIIGLVVAVLVASCGGGGEDSQRKSGATHTENSIETAQNRVAIENISVAEDTSYSGQLVYPFRNRVPSAFVVLVEPAHGSVTLNPVSGNFDYIPEPDYFGNDSFTYAIRIRNQRDQEVNTIPIEVRPVPDAPRLEQITELENSATERITRTSLKIHDPDGDPVTVEVASQDTSIASVEYDAGSDEIALEPHALGDTEVSVEASDGTNQTSASFVFHVRRVVRTERVLLEDPTRNVIVVTNVLDQPVDFGLAWNKRKIYESRADMVTEATANSRPEPLARALALARFVRRNTYHAMPISSSQWVHDPLLLMNSVGWGYCDDVASALAHLARTDGHPARVWALGRHVVPEIWLDNGWRLIDPDLAVLYRNESGEVASVEEVQARPDLITQPFSPIYQREVTQVYGYQPFIADIYAYTEDNFVWPWYDEGSPEVSGTFLLAPGAQLKFPAIWTDAVTDDTGAAPLSYATALLVLPTGYTGKIRLPLVARAIHGAGQVMVRGRTLAVGSPELNEVMARYWLQIPEVEIISATAPIEIVMLVNPIGASLQAENIVYLKSQFSWGLRVESEALPENVRPVSSEGIPNFPFDWTP